MQNAVHRAGLVPDHMRAHMRDGCSRAEPLITGTLGALVSILPTRIGCFNAPNSGQEMLHRPVARELDSLGRRGASGHDVPSQEWEVGHVLDEEQGSGASIPWNTYSPLPTSGTP